MHPCAKRNATIGLDLDKRILKILPIPEKDAVLIDRLWLFRRDFYQGFGFWCE